MILYTNKTDILEICKENEYAIRIDVLNRDLNRLNDLNQEHLDTIDKYKQKLIDE